MPFEPPRAGTTAKTRRPEIIVSLSAGPDPTLQEKHASPNFEPSPMLDDGLSFGAWHSIDGWIFIDRVVVIMCGRYLFDHTTVVGTELVPRARQYDRRISWLQYALAAVDVEMHFTPENLERFFFLLMEVVRV
jgi:hypothetical protein